jgi:hypothetical protein
MRTRNPQAEERGLSDVVSFTLMFTTIIVSVALVSSFGINTLELVQQGEQKDSAEHSFQTITQQFNELAAGGPHRRTSRMNLDSGSLLIRDGTTMRIEVNGGYSPAVDQVFDLRSLEYEQAETAVSYEGGATFRGSRDYSGGSLSYNSVVKRDPPMTCTDDVALLSFIRLEGEDTRKISSGTVTLVATRTSQSFVYPKNRTGRHAASDATSVDLHVQNSQFHKDAWVSYLDAASEWTAIDSDSFTCDDVDRVVVKRTVIDVEFLR